METDDDFEVFPENSPHSIHYKNLGYQEADFLSIPPVDDNVSVFKYPASSMNKFSTTFSTILGRIGTLLKKFIYTSVKYQREIDLLKHSGLLFKENHAIVEELSPPLSFYEGKKSSFSNLVTLISLHVFSSLILVFMNRRKSLVIPTTLSFSVTSISLASKLYQRFSEQNRLNCLDSLLSSLKYYNQTYLKSLQFIRENDKIMMENYSNICRMEITGFNSYKVLDSSWLQFKASVSNSASTILKNLYLECRRLNDSYNLNERFQYLTVSSVDSSSILISPEEAESPEAFNALLNKLKLLLFLIESEYLSFIAVILLINDTSCNVETSDVFTASKEISQTITNFTKGIEIYFEKLYRASRQESLFQRKVLPPTSNSDIVNIFFETRALALTTSSAAVQARNLEKIMEGDLKVIEDLSLENYSHIFAYVNEAIPTIQFELLSAQHKLNSLEKHLITAQRCLNPQVDENLMSGNNALEVGEACNTVKTGIEVGTSDFSLTQPDEVFIGISVDEADEANSTNEDYFSEEKFVQEALNRSSKKLIKELKIKLKDKQTEMVEREKAALERKQISDVVDEENLSFQLFDFEQNTTILSDNIDSSNYQPDESKLCFDVRPVSHEICPPQQFIISLPNESPVEDADNHASIVLPNRGDQSCGSIIESERSTLNPLAMSITSISRSWNRELHRTEECFGSDSGSGSDTDYG